jgi:putative PEP-CTERM system histidine kinase
MDLAFVLALASALIAGAIALTTVGRKRTSSAHWFFAAGMLVLAAERVCSAVSSETLHGDDIARWHLWRITAMSLLPGLWLGFSMAYSRGESALRPLGARLLLGQAFSAPLACATFLHLQPLSSLLGRMQPSCWFVDFGRGGGCLHALFLLNAIAILMNLERTYRASIGTMRWRIKYMLLGVGFLFAVRAYTASQALLFHRLSPSLGVVDSAALLLACLLILRAWGRQGSFDVTVYPSQVVLRSSVTVLLTGLYLLVVGGLVKAAGYAGPELSFQIKAVLILVACAFLTVFLLSEKARLRIRQFVSRHFQRPLHDYRAIWTSLTHATARRLHERELAAAVAKAVSDIFSVLSVTVWLGDDQRQRLLLSASTSIPNPERDPMELSGKEAAQVIEALGRMRGPVDFEHSAEPWARVLRRVHPGEFQGGGNRLCAPMTACGERVGFLTLGDRVSGMPYSAQDLDLLGAVCEHAGASFLNAQLARKLSDTKQFEGFQAMSAFFVHDLKNTASTLTLMLQNFPLHYQDAAFREDALRGISRTVAHINDLIQKLNSVRQDQDLKLEPCDLNEIVEQAIESQAVGVDIVKRLQPLPRIQCDPRQIQRVIVNLLLNAREAVGSRGRVCVETCRDRDWVVFAVTDNGCGMTAEFVQQHLFRPFQSTKKQGMGIGMFQAKVIVDAHQGKIEVESEPGQGSTFRVRLPLN